VPKRHIRRLYETDAKGIYDRDLIDEVGWALYSRCESLLAAEEARAGRAKCHACGATIHHSHQKEEVLRCPSCGWQVTWAAYFNSIQHKQLSGPDLIAPFRAYVSRFPRARTPRQRMLLIDRLLHAFHWAVSTGPRRPAAINLIQGRLSEVIQFLDSLTYSTSSTPGTRETLSTWRGEMSTALQSWGAPPLDDPREA